jgi:HlyD family secretion protein
VKLRRARDLDAKQLIARSDLDAAESTARAAAAGVKSAEAQLVQAQASLNHADVNLSHTTIRAPIDGVVIARNVDVGQTVAASMQAPTLFVIAQDLTEMRVDAKVDESDIGKVQPEQPVRFRVDAYPNETFVGMVSQVRLQPVVEQNVVSYVTVIDVPNKDLKLKPGMSAAVTIETGRVNDVLTVPNAALRFEPDDELFARLGQQAPAPPEASVRPRQVSTPSVEDRGARGRSRAVWVFQAGQLTRVAVQPGLSDGKQTMVAGPLTPGMQVATSAATAEPAPATMRSPLLPTGRRSGAGGRS